MYIYIYIYMLPEQWATIGALSVLCSFVRSINFKKDFETVGTP
jgi:hypothetical protein